MTNISGSSRFLIVGSGGIGGYYGGLLAKFGYDVTFLARGEHYDAIKKNGLKVESSVGNFIVNPSKVIKSLSELDSVDVVLFCVKTYDTIELASSLKSIIDTNTIIISIQNGIENDFIIKDILANAKVYPGFAHIISSKSAPGLIKQTGGPRTIFFGDRTNKDLPILQDLSELMKVAGIESFASENIEKGLWEKFIFIAAFSGFTGAGRCNIGKILHNKKAYDLFKESVKESIEVGRSCDVNFEDTIFDDVMNRAEDYRGEGEGATSSLMRDLVADRKTEVNTLSGTIARIGKEKGVAVPVNNFLYILISLSSKSN